MQQLAAEGLTGGLLVPLTEEELVLLAEDAGATQLALDTSELSLGADLDLEALAREDEEIRRRTARALAQREDDRDDWSADVATDLVDSWREEQQRSAARTVAAVASGSTPVPPVLGSITAAYHPTTRRHPTPPCLPTKHP